MYHENKWYCLDFKKNINSNNLLDSLDINILNDYCLKPFLNIKDVNNDERIRFIAGCHGLEALENKYSVAKFSSLEWKPLNSIEISNEDDAKSLLILLEKLEEIDDVQNVFSNFNINDSLMENLI